MWAMDYFLTFGKFKDAPKREILLDQFPDYESLVKDTVGAAPSYLADRIQSDYTRRQAQEAMSHYLPVMAENPQVSVSAMRDEFTRIIDACTPMDSCIEYGKDMDAYRHHMEAQRELMRVPYPFKEVDDAAGGIRVGELAVLVAPAGTGKSIMACKFALEAIRQGHNVYIATLELSVETIAQRIEYMVVNEEKMQVPITEYQRGNKVPQYDEAIRKAQDKIAAMPGKLVIEHPRVENRTPTALVQACKSKGCGFLIVDQLQFVTKPKRQTLQEEYGAALQEFKTQIMSPADNVKIPMLLLHQMNRAGARTQQRGTGLVGSMTDIAGSSWVEQISDVVWGIGRNEEERNNNIMNMATLKVRNMDMVGFRLSWDASYSYQFDVLRDKDGRAIRLQSW